MSSPVTSHGQASREEQVIERITAMRKRRPRLIDEVVTLASAGLEQSIGERDRSACSMNPTWKRWSR